MVPSKGGPLYRRHKAPLSPFVACSSGFYLLQLLRRGCGYMANTAKRSRGGSFSARLSRGLPPAWGLGTRALRTVRGHSTQSNLTPYPKAAPNASLGDLELVCVLATAFMFFMSVRSRKPYPKSSLSKQSSKRLVSPNRFCPQCGC